MKIFAFCDIAFEPIKIQTCSAPQNNRLNLSFVKYIKVAGKKWLEMVIKRTFVSDNNYETPSSTPISRRTRVSTYADFNLWTC